MDISIFIKVKMKSTLGLKSLMIKYSFSNKLNYGPFIYKWGVSNTN